MVRTDILDCGLAVNKPAHLCSRGTSQSPREGLKQPCLCRVDPQVHGVTHVPSEAQMVPHITPNR